MDKMYDVAIVGSGPAGLSAAINAKIRNKNLIIFGSSESSSKLIKAPEINNYLGFYSIKGVELDNKFKNHIEALGITIVNERINSVYSMGDFFTLMVNEKMYQSKTVIIATGIEYAKPLKGEEEFLGKGVGYCATCDAPLYKDKIVIVVGWNKEGEKEANFVSELAKKLYYIPMYEGNYNLKKGIEIIRDNPLQIMGDTKVKKLILKNREIEADGIFLLRDSISPAQLVPGLETVEGHIKVNRDMSTNIKGCFAVGDCTGKPYQYMKAAGEGQVAALNAVSYIDR